MKKKGKLKGTCTNFVRLPPIVWGELCWWSTLRSRLDISASEQFAGLAIDQTSVQQLAYMQLLEVAAAAAGHIFAAAALCKVAAVAGGAPSKSDH